MFKLPTQVIQAVVFLGVTALVIFLFWFTGHFVSTGAIHISQNILTPSATNITNYDLHCTDYGNNTIRCIK